MTETKFTPGPWSLEGSRILTEDTHIAECSIGRADTPYVSIVEEEQANAALIAAAPELYEALKECVEGVIELGEFQYGWKHVVSRAKAALTKATTI